MSTIQMHDQVRMDGREGVFIVIRIDEATKDADVIARNKRGHALDVPLERLHRVPSRWGEMFA